VAAPEKFADFASFWRFYLSEHSRPLTRRLHFLGTTAAMACLVVGLTTRWHWVAYLGLLAGYGPAWIAHFFVEHNKPATFHYPLRSLVADLVLWWKMLTGQLGKNMSSK